MTTMRCVKIPKSNIKKFLLFEMLLRVVGGNKARNAKSYHFFSRLQRKKVGKVRSKKESVKEDVVAQSFHEFSFSRLHFWFQKQFPRPCLLKPLLMMLALVFLCFDKNWKN